MTLLTTGLIDKVMFFNDGILFFYEKQLMIRVVVANRKTGRSPEGPKTQYKNVN